MGEEGGQLFVNPDSGVQALRVCTWFCSTRIRRGDRHPAIRRSVQPRLWFNCQPALRRSYVTIPCPLRSYSPGRIMLPLVAFTSKVDLAGPCIM